MKNFNLIITVILAITIANGCKKEDNTSASNNANNTGGTTINLTLGSNSPVAVGGTLNLTASAISGASYYWTGPNSFISSSQNPIRTNFALADTGNYACTATTGGYYGNSYSGSIHVSAQ